MTRLWLGIMAHTCVEWLSPHNGHCWQSTCWYCNQILRMLGRSSNGVRITLVLANTLGSQRAETFDRVSRVDVSCMFCLDSTRIALIGPIWTIDARLKAPLFYGGSCSMEVSACWDPSSVFGRESSRLMATESQWLRDVLIGKGLQGSLVRPQDRTKSLRWMRTRPWH